jgi:hypothetical protein
MSDNNYQLFQPSLVSITNRNPQLRVLIETTYNGTIAHDKHVSIECRWDPPLKVGAQQYRRLDLYREKDL